MACQTSLNRSAYSSKQEVEPNNYSSPRKAACDGSRDHQTVNGILCLIPDSRLQLSDKRKALDETFNSQTYSRFQAYESKKNEKIMKAKADVRSLNFKIIMQEMKALEKEKEESRKANKHLNYHCTEAKLIDRLDSILDKKQKDIIGLKKEIMEQRRAEETQECTFKPEINKRNAKSKSSSKRTVNDLMQWSSQKKAKLLALELDTKLNSSNQPVINKRSASIISRERSASNKVKVEDRLLRFNALKEEKIKNLKEQRRQEEFHSNTSNKSKSSRKSEMCQIAPRLLQRQLEGHFLNKSPLKTVSKGKEAAESASKVLKMGAKKKLEDLTRRKLEGMNPSEAQKGASKTPNRLPDIQTLHGSNKTPTKSKNTEYITSAKKTNKENSSIKGLKSSPIKPGLPKGVLKEIHPNLSKPTEVETCEHIFKMVGKAKLNIDGKGRVVSASKEPKGNNHPNHKLLNPSFYETEEKQVSKAIVKGNEKTQCSPLESEIRRDSVNHKRKDSLNSQMPNFSSTTLDSRSYKAQVSKHESKESLNTHSNNTDFLSSKTTAIVEKKREAPPTKHPIASKPAGDPSAQDEEDSIIVYSEEQVTAKRRDSTSDLSKVGSMKSLGSNGQGLYYDFQLKKWVKAIRVVNQDDSLENISKGDRISKASEDLQSVEKEEYFRYDDDQVLIGDQSHCSQNSVSAMFMQLEMMIKKQKGKRDQIAPAANGNGSANITHEFIQLNSISNKDTLSAGNNSNNDSIGGPNHDSFISKPKINKQRSSIFDKATDGGH